MSEARKIAMGFVESARKKFKNPSEAGYYLNDDDEIAPIPRIKTGSLLFDQAMFGGYPVGRIIEIFGPESSGKTTLTLHAMAEAQRQFPNKAVAFVDAENALDMAYAANLGVNLDSLVVKQADCAEDALDAMIEMASSGLFSVIVLDSIAALSPRAEIEGDMGDSNMGKAARLMSQFCRKVVGVTPRTGTTVIMLNQLRKKIGVVFGNPEVTTGGEAMKFYASVRVDIRIIGKEKEDDEFGANKVRIKVVKNKTAPPFRECETRILYGAGIDVLGEIVDLGTKMGIFEKKGTWYSYQPPTNEATGEWPDLERIGQGSSSVIARLQNDKALYDEVVHRINHVVTD